MRLRAPWAAVLLGLPLGFMAVFFLAPFIVLALQSIKTPDGSLTLAHYQRLFADFYYLGVMITTFKLSLLATLVSFLIGYPIAYVIVVIVRSRLVRRLCYIIVIMPLFTSNIVRSFGWMILLGKQGLVNQMLIAAGITSAPISILFSETSIVIGLAYILVPFMVLSIAGVLQTIDKSLVEASLDLGASRIATFAKIVFPLSLPGVIAGTLIVFTLAVSAYVVPAIMSGGRTVVMSMSIYEQYGSVFDVYFGATLAVALLVVTLVLTGLYVLLIDGGLRRKREVTP